MIFPFYRMIFPLQAKARVLAGWEDGWMDDGPIINKRYHIFLKPDHSQSRAEKAIQRLDELHVPKLIVLVVIVCNDCFNEVVC